MSNRSSHFAHRFQTLPSALAGVPGSRRLLALAVVLALLALALLPTAGQAQTVAPDDVAVVPQDWSLIPRGESQGQQFRLLFVTSTSRNASSTDIDDYNTFVQNRAAAGHDDIREYQSGFRVVGSTADVNAWDNTATTGTGVRIYWLNGNKVADNYADFYDGSWDDEVAPRDESGNAHSRTGQEIFPATGSRHNGFKDTRSGGTVLGADVVRVGELNNSDGAIGPLESTSRQTKSASAEFYGLSQIFQVEGLPTTGTPYDYSDDDRAPRNLSVQVEAGGVALRWLPPAEDAASVDGYEILRRRPNRDEPTLTTLVPDTGTTDTTYFDATATEPGVRYTYRVKAIRYGASSTDWSNIAMVLRPPSAPPPPPPLVSNIGQSASATATINKQYAQGFRLGTHGQGYAISSVSIDLAAVPSSLTVSLWIDSPPGYAFRGTPRRKLFDFENPPSFRVGLNKFTAPAGAFAYQNVDYYIVLSGFGSSVRIKETTSDEEDAGGETGAILLDRACERALDKIGFWEGSCSRGSVLRLAVEGSSRDRGILASTYALPWVGNQEIVSVGDKCCFELKVKSAGRYLIRGLSLLGDGGKVAGGFPGLPFEVKEGSDKLFTLAFASARGDSLKEGLDEELALTGPAGMNEWTASQGATLEGGCPTFIETETVMDEDGNETEVETEVVRCKTYTLDMKIESIEGDDPGATRGGVTFGRMFGLDAGKHETQNYDTPKAPGVTFAEDRTRGRDDVSLEIPHMAILGEPLYAMVSNLGQTDSGYVSLGGSVSKVLAQKFTTGPGSYRLKGIGINIEGSGDSNDNAQVPSGPSSVSVAVHIDEAGSVGLKVFDLVSPGEFVPGHSFFEAPPGTSLLPNTTYAVVWSHLGGSWHRLQRTSSNDEDSGAQPGFRIHNSFLVGDLINSVGPHTSGDALEMAVYGEPVSDTTMVSNLGQSDNGYVSLGGTNKVLAQSFTTGPDRYRLEAIGINIEGSDDSDGNAQVPDGPSSVSVEVRTQTGGSTSVKVFDLVSPNEFEPGISVFKAPPGALLEPNTTYAVVWSHLEGTGHRFQKTMSNNEDSGSLRDFTIGNGFRVAADRGSIPGVPGENSLEMALYGSAEGAPPTLDGSYQVGKNWFHIPDDVLVGEQFRLVFVTQARTDAMSGDIEDYDAIVQEEAAWEGNHRIIRGVAPEFKAVVCTADVDARTYTEIPDALDVPIYWLDGGWDDRPRLIANSHYDFYDGVWIYHGDDEDTINTEYGAIAAGNSTYFSERRLMWTGCADRGIARPNAHMGTTSDMGMVAVGTPGDPRREFGPLGAGVDRTDYITDEIDKRHQIYAISPVFTVVVFD